MGVVRNKTLHIGLGISFLGWLRWLKQGNQQWSCDSWDDIPSVLKLGVPRIGILVLTVLGLGAC